MNRFPAWKNWLVIGVVLVGSLLALPNLFGDDPAVYVARADGGRADQQTIGAITSLLAQHNVPHDSAAIDGSAALIRFEDVDDQLRANAVLRTGLEDYTVALTLAPRTPAWLQALGLRPMSLGLDLRGGVHFLYQVALDDAIGQFLTSYEIDLRNRFRDADVRARPDVSGRAIEVALLRPEDADRAERIIRSLDGELELQRIQIDGAPGFRVTMSDNLIRERQDFAIQQNTITLRNRVNELGVAEPVVQRQGLDRILVQLPGVQDPAQAERVLGSTATLQFRLVDWQNDAYDADRRRRAPVGSELFYDRDRQPVLLRRDVIATGDQLLDANSGYTEGRPAVFVRLNAQAARRMLDTTQANLGRPMGVLFIEEKPELVERNGELVLGDSVREQTVINVATIRGVFSSNFQITGLTPFEAQDLALLLRAGALAAPIVKVEERTIGPSLGRDNIEKGRLAVIVGFMLVVVFMTLYYRTFGMVANLALLTNVVLIIAVLSLLQASLTLPGIAGIVLTVGMAVDANVLIFERIREELRNGNSPQASIRGGYEKAFSTIADANVTTLIAALVLFVFGTGPIKGFAVTLSIGIMTSMFTAIIGTRAVVNWIYGRRQQVERLSIGGRAQSYATA
jgi:preprotein translocase subunit SecD